MHPKAQIEMPSFDLYLIPSVHFALNFARQFGVDDHRLTDLRCALESVLKMVQEKNAEGGNENPVIMEVWEDGGKMWLRIINRGVPIVSDQETRRFMEIARCIDGISIENNGRKGQAILLSLLLGKGPLNGFAGETGERLPAVSMRPEEIRIRQLEPHEATSLSQLFYFIYGYNYINEIVYFPKKLQAMLEDGKLMSTVATLPSGQLIGHVALMQWGSTPPVYESCLGVVDPRVKAQGIFSRVFKSMMDQLYKTSMQYCFFDYVTNHDFSQRLVSPYGTCDLALFVGSQSKETQVRLKKLGLGHDPEDMDRYSILYSVLPRTEHAFGREISLPSTIGENVGFLLEPLNLGWNPTPRFSTPAAEGEYKSEYQPAQLSALFDLHQPGLAAVERILGEWRSLLQNGYQYAAVDVPLDSQGVGVIHDILASRGFFIAGFVPHRHSSQLAFRFQTIAHAKVAFDKIKVHTPSAKRLLEIIRQDHERNRIL